MYCHNLPPETTALQKNQSDPIAYHFTEYTQTLKKCLNVTVAHVLSAQDSPVISTWTILITGQASHARIAEKFSTLRKGESRIRKRSISLYIMQLSQPQGWFLNQRCPQRLQNRFHQNQELCQLRPYSNLNSCAVQLGMYCKSNNIATLIKIPVCSIKQWPLTLQSSFRI